MAEREGTSPQGRASDKKAVLPHEDPKYLGLLKGICPSTGQGCEALEGLRFLREVNRDSFRMGGGSNFSFGSMTYGQREAYDRYNETAEEIADQTQKALKGNCIDICILSLKEK